MPLLHPDIVIYWNGRKVAEGLDAARDFHTQRLGFGTKVRADYQLRKTLRAAEGDTICVEWESSYRTDDGQLVRGRAGEFWTMRYGLLIEWRAYYQRRRRRGGDLDDIPARGDPGRTRPARSAGIDRQGVRPDCQGRRDGRHHVRLRRNVAARLPALGACPHPVSTTSGTDRALPRRRGHDSRARDGAVVRGGEGGRMRCHHRCCRARRDLRRHRVLHAVVHLARMARSSASIAR